MSHALYFTRLYFLHGHGIAKLHGRTLILDDPPSMDGRIVSAIDYAPEIDCRQISESGQWRRMSAEEVKWADKFLQWALQPA